MKTKELFVSVRRSALLVQITVLAVSVHAAELASWKGAELMEWTKHVHKMANAHMTAEGLSITAVDNDPQLTVSIKKPFTGKSNHYVEIVLRSALAGRHQLFWGSEKIKDFTALRCADFNVPKAGEWTTCTIRPCWISEGRITKLRIDPPNPLRDTFELKRVFEEGEDTAIDTKKTTGVVFEAKTAGQEYASITWITDASPGEKLIGFTTSPDAARHTYWFDFTNQHNLTYRYAGKDSWKGMVYVLETRKLLADKPFPVDNMRLINGRPNLPPDVGITYAGPELAIPRAGRPLALELILRNYGTVPAQNVRFALDGLPAGCRVLNAADLSPTGEIAACEGWDSVGNDHAFGSLPNERRFRITLSDPGPGLHSFSLSVSADGMATRTVPVKADVKQSLGLAKADYVPVPKPAKTGRYEIGAFLFPGWVSHQWHGVWTRAPHRKPVLGWYDETNPEVVDWQIKHLVENGVSFVFVDWYWKNGREGRNHWPKVFAQGRYRHLLKWSLMWCAHGTKGQTEEEMRQLTKVWLDSCFKDPQYMRVGDSPVVSVWSIVEFGPDCRKLMDISRQMAREAGYKGIHFIAVRHPDGRTDREFLEQFKTLGFDGTCVYKYMGHDDPKAPLRVDGFQSYGYLAESSLRHWREMHENSSLPFLPSLTTAYDDRPWRGEKSHPVSNINPTDFKRICEDAKKFSAETGITRFLIGPLDEWGEGSIGYPNREHGFGMLEAVRDTFGEKPADGWPVNCAPEDVGLGPYPRPDDPIRN